MMKYLEKAPSSKLRSIVKNYWCFEIPETNNEQDVRPIQHEVLPDGTCSIVFIRHPYYKGIRILGPQLKKFQQQVFPGSVFLGIRFNPWISFPALFDDKTAIRNETVDPPQYILDMFSSFNFKNLVNNTQLFDLIELAASRIIQSNRIQKDLLMKFICIDLEQGNKIQEIITDIPLSIRPIQKRFKQVTGLTMSEFRNIVRLQNTVRSIFNDQNKKMEYIYDQGYYDQSHFINDFKKHMNKPLDEFLAYVQTIEH